MWLQRAYPQYFMNFIKGLPPAQGIFSCEKNEYAHFPHFYHLSLINVCVCVQLCMVISQIGQRSIPTWWTTILSIKALRSKSNPKWNSVRGHPWMWTVKNNDNMIFFEGYHQDLTDYYEGMIKFDEKLIKIKQTVWRKNHSVSIISQISQILKEPVQYRSVQYLSTGSINFSSFIFYSTLLGILLLTTFKVLAIKQRQQRTDIRRNLKYYQDVTFWCPTCRFVCILKVGWEHIVSFSINTYIDQSYTNISISNSQHHYSVHHLNHSLASTLLELLLHSWLSAQNHVSGRMEGIARLPWGRAILVRVTEFTFIQGIQGETS